MGGRASHQGFALGLVREGIPILFTAEVDKVPRRPDQNGDPSAAIGHEADTRASRPDGSHGPTVDAVLVGGGAGKVTGRGEIHRFPYAGGSTP